MARLRSLALASLLAALLLSGCTASNGPGGQSASADGSLAYNGASTGSHSEEFRCDGSGSVHASANLGSGEVRITVRDGNGATVYSRTIESPGQDGRSEPVRGASGQWTLTATRSTNVSPMNPYPSFSGQYAIHVDC